MKPKLEQFFPLFLLIFFVGQFVGQKVLAQTIKQEKEDEKIIWLKQGVLETGDLIFSDDGSLYDVYDLDGKADQSVKIILHSLNFKTILILLNPQGEIIAKNYNFDKDINDSEISITLPQDGTYRLIINAYNAKSKGGYIVKIIELDGISARKSDFIPSSSELIYSEKIKASQLYQQGLEQYLSRNWKDAFKSWEQALFFYRKSGETRRITFLQEAIRGLNLYLSARNQFNQGNFQEALNKYEQIATILAELSQQIKQEGDLFGVTLNHLTLGKAGNFLDIGDVYFVLGQYQKALDNYNLALLNYQEIKNQVGEIDSYLFIGKIYWKQGDYPEALNNFEQALKLSKKINRQDLEEKSLENLGGIYLEFGQSLRALKYYEQAFKLSQNLLNIERQSTALNNLGLWYLNNSNYSQALNYFNQALEIDNKSADPPNLASVFLNLGATYRGQKNYNKALDYYNKALDILKKTGALAMQSSADNSLGLLYLDMKQYGLALQHLMSARTISQQIGSQKLEATSLNNIGILYYSQEDYKKATEYFAIGSEIEEKLLTQNLALGSEFEKFDYLKTFSGKTDVTISLNLQSAPNNPEATHLALKTILQRKGRILDVLTNSLQILRQQINDPESQTLLEQLIQKQTQLSNLTFQKTETIKSPEIHRQQLANLQNETQQLEDKLSRRSAEFRNLSQPITLEAIQKLIPTNAALVEIVRYQPFNPKATKESEKFGNPHYAVYILFANGKIKTKDLGETQFIDDNVTAFRRNLADSKTPIPQLQKSARQLDEKLTQPIRQLLGNTKTLLLSPDSTLNLIPFEALVDENNQYLVENYQITYLTSGRDLLRQKEKFASQQPPLIIANPLYDPTGKKVVLNPNSIRSINIDESVFPRLEATEAEAEAIKKLLPQATVLTQAQATENALKQVKKPNILHIATHGFFSKLTDNKNSGENENPLLRSGLVFAGVKVSQSAGDDGVLSALEATNLNLVGTKLVVLSACDTGNGDATTGEGVYGLRRALVIAGSESQLISLWKVSDSATKDLMIAYYQRLKKGEGRSEALRQTQLAMLKSEKQNHPFYWASFIPSGDSSPMKFD
jgi:CHAT domain-containing protein/Tfp pilus assembly protein PilF